MRARTRSVDDTRALGEALGRATVGAGDLLVLAGDLGSGKTALAQGLARALGVTDRVVSPTFTIVREYEGTIPVVHADVYRIDTLQELYDIGFEEVYGDDRVTMIEWGDVVVSVLPPDRLLVHLEMGESDDERLVTVVPHGPRWHARNAAITAALAPWACEPEGDR